MSKCEYDHIEIKILNDLVSEKTRLVRRNLLVVISISIFLGLSVEGMKYSNFLWLNIENPESRLVANGLIYTLLLIEFITFFIYVYNDLLRWRYEKLNLLNEYRFCEIGSFSDTVRSYTDLERGKEQLNNETAIELKKRISDITGAVNTQLETLNQDVSSLKTKINTWNSRQNKLQTIFIDIGLPFIGFCIASYLNLCNWFSFIGKINLN